MEVIDTLIITAVTQIMFILLLVVALAALLVTFYICVDATKRMLRRIANQRKAKQ